MEMSTRMINAGRSFAIAVALSLAGTAAWAETLDKASCDKLKTEQQALVKDGVKADLDKGADAGKAALQPARLDAIKRYIAIEEDLKFRCRHGPVPVGDDDGAEPAGGAAAAKKKPAVKAQSTDAKPAAKVKAAAKSEPAKTGTVKSGGVKSAGTDSGGSAETQAEKSKVTVKAKAKSKAKPAAEDVAN